MALESIGSEELAQSAAVKQGDVIVVEDLWRTYDMGMEQQVQALRGISMSIKHNEYVAIMGPSGSGKSTLMNLIGCLDTPSKGKYWLNGQLVSELEGLAADIDFFVVPPLCPLVGSPYDFTRSADHIQRAIQTTDAWLAQDGLGRSGIPAEMRPHSH